MAIGRDIVLDFLACGFKPGRRIVFRRKEGIQALACGNNGKRTANNSRFFWWFVVISAIEIILIYLTIVRHPD